MKVKSDLTAEDIERVLRYDQETGMFYWRPRPDGPPEWNTRYAGERAGTINKDGYRQIKIGDRLYYAHRLAWLVLKREWPKGEIDHREIDNRDDNRESNLRDATHSENAQNRRKYATNTSGYKGVCWDKSRGKWIVIIQVNGKQKNIGRYKTKEEAKRAYEEAARSIHGEFARTS